jgi:hypothetical protein
MMKIKVPQIGFPFYLFFKNGALLLPLVSGDVTNDALTSLIKERFHFVDIQKNRTEENAHNFSKSKKENLEKVVSLGKTFKRKEDWSEKLRKMILGFRALSKEAKSYRLHERWVRNKESLG